MYDEIAANKRNSWILVVVVALFLVGIGFFAGEYWGSRYAGVTLAVVIAAISALAAYYGGAGMILTMSRKRTILNYST